MASTANPFFPGYYVGDPLPKPLKDKRKYGPPNEYKFDIFSEYLDWVGSDVTGLPTWVKDRVLGDWKSSLKAEIKPQKEIPIEVYDQYGEETQQDQPGAYGIEVNLNPVDWFADPGKQIQKTATNWVGSAFDWDDFDVRSKAKLWKSLLDGKPAGKSTFENAVTGLAVEAIAKKTGGRSAADLAIMGKVMVDDIDKRKVAYDPITGTSSPANVKIDAYAEVANSIKQFQLYSAAAPNRESKYEDVIFNSASAIIADIEHSKQSLLNPTGKILSPEQIKQHELMKAKVDIAKLMGNTGDLVGGKDGLDKVLSVFHQEAGNERLIDTGGGVMRKVKDVTKDKAKKKLDVVSQHIWGAPASGSFPAVKSVEERLNDILSTVADPRERAHLGGVTKTYLEMVGDLKRKIPQTPTVPSGFGALLLRRDIGAVGAVRGRVFSGGDMLVPSSRNRLLKEVARDITYDRSGLIEHGAVNGWAMKRYIPRLSEERQYGEVVQFARDLEGGKLMQNYIWPRARRLMEGFTPAYATKNFLAKTHFFGLIVDSDAIDEGTSFRLFNSIVKSSGLFNHNIHLKFEVNIPGSVNPLRLFAKVAGDKKLEFIKIASSLMDPEGAVLMNEAALVYLFGLKGGAVNFTDFITANGGVNPFVGKDLAKSKEAYDEFFKQFRKFEDWVKKNKKLSGAAANAGLAINDPDFMLGIFKGLRKYHMNKDMLDLTRKYVGVLEKVWSKLNQAQTWVFNKVGKFLAPISYLKTIITESLATGITTSLEALLAGTGIGAILLPLMEALKFILKFVIRKILDFAQAIITAILKMDFSGIYKSISKTFEGLVKAALSIAVIPLVIILLLFLMFGALISTITAFNPTFMQSGAPVYVGGGGSLTLPPPDPNIACPVKDGIVSEGSYEAATQLGHGSNDYWGSYGGCGYTIPFLMYSLSDACPSLGAAAACSPMESANVCKRARILPSQPYYGFAADIAPAPAGEKFVYLSSLGGTVTSWVVSSSPIPISDGGWGYGIFFTSSDGVYKIYYGHLDDTGLPGLGQTLPAGNAFGRIADYVTFNPHTHVELLQRQTSGFYTGTYYPVKPETWFNCN